MTALRAAIPEAADGYRVNLDDSARAALGMTENDPLVSALAQFAHTNGKPQGWVDDALEAASALASQGLFDVGFDPVAETAALGDNGQARQREVEVFAEALKQRGEVDEEEYGELLSLAPTAAGTRLVEKIRKWMGGAGDIPAPTEGGAVVTEDAAKEAARQLAKDERYGKDRAFTAQADREWKKAFGGA